MINDSWTTDSSTATKKVVEVIPSSQVQFWTFLIFQIPSLACTIFLLYHLLSNPQLRRALHNHVIIIFLFLTLFIEIFGNSLYIDAYRFGGHKNSFPMSTSICLIWWFIDYGFYGAITVFLAWGSIERHILVFHYHQLLRTSRQKLLIHYLPLTIITIYLLGFYIGVIFFPPCQNIFDFEALACGLLPCYGDISSLNTWDHLGNRMICTFIETLSSLALLIRILWQKHRVRQQISWRKHRKMAFQLLSISCLSLTIVVPQALIVVIQESGGSTTSNFGATALPYFSYLYTFVVLVLPFICLGYLPELWPKLFFLKFKRQQKIGTITPTVDRSPSNLTQTRPIRDNTIFPTKKSIIRERKLMT